MLNMLKNRQDRYGHAQTFNEPSDVSAHPGNILEKLTGVCIETLLLASLLTGGTLSPPQYRISQTEARAEARRRRT